MRFPQFHPRAALALMFAVPLGGCDDPHVAKPTEKSPSPIVMAPEGAYPDGAAFALGGVPIMKDDIESLVPLMRMIDPHLVDSSLRRVALANAVLPIAAGVSLDPAAREDAFQRAQAVHTSVRETGVFPPGSPEPTLLTGSWKDVGLIPFNAAMSMEPGTYSGLLEAPGSWVFFKLIATNLVEGESFDAFTEITIQRYDVFYLAKEGSADLLQSGIDNLPLEIVDPEWEHIIPPILLYQSRQ
jgi:hypothetical protein